MEKIVKCLKREVLRSGDQEVMNGGYNLALCNEYTDAPGPLHSAAIGDRFAVAQFLLEKGCLDPNVTNPQGTTPLHTAARYNSVTVADLLIKKDAELGIADAAANTPLMVASSLGHSAIVELLLKADKSIAINLEQRDSFGNSALHLAAAGGHLEVVNLLSTWSANLWALNDAGETPLQVAEKCRSRRVCEYLAQRVGSSEPLVNTSLPDTSDLVLSVLQNQLECVQIASLDQLAHISPDDGKTLLHWAAVRDSADCAQHLLGCGFDVDATDQYGSSALHYAAMNNAERVCGLLLEVKANVNLQDGSGLTPLMLCMIEGHEAISRLLVQTGSAQLNLLDSEGETALMHAARRGNQALAKLVMRGSNILQKNKSGLSALEISELEGHGDMSRLIEKHRPSPDVYPRESSKNGYCLIINQVYESTKHLENEQLKLSMRWGSEYDVKRINDLFQCRLGFKVDEKTDLTSEGIIQEMKRVSTKVDRVDYFVCFILAHGLGKAIFGTDGKLMPIKDIAQQVDVEHCRALVGKPKIFFIQACRNNLQVYVDAYKQQPNQAAPSDPASQPGKPLDVAKYIDFFFGFSTWEDCVSYRRKSGTLYIQELCDIIEEDHTKMDLLKMMTRVCHKIGSTPVPGKEPVCYMVPNIKSTLQKDVKF